MSAKTSTAKTAAAAGQEPTPDTTEPKPADVDARTKSAVSKDGTAVCGGCKADLPITKYPTKRNAEGEYVRDTTECRSCRDARRVVRKTERQAAKEGATSAAA